VDLAVMIADGGEAIADLPVLRDQAELFGAVASDPTAWRVLSGVDGDALVRLRAARAKARELAWAQADETRDGLPASTAAGQPVPGLVLDLDASIVICHSDKESATRTWKKTFGYHPLLCFLDGSREALSGLLRAGRAGSNTTADHITVLDAALAQIPDGYRYGTEILIGSDSAGCTYGFLTHIRSLREHGVHTFFSVGVAITEPIREAIRAATDTPPGHGSIQFLEARDRAHARVEDRIRTGKDTGFGRFPSRVLAINAAWLELALAGIDLLAWTQHLLLYGDFAAAEPKKLRYRLLHVAARITRSARRTRLRIAEDWPWAEQLVTAFDRLAALPQSVT
jgi:hypothetical protein